MPKQRKPRKTEELALTSVQASIIPLAYLNRSLAKRKIPTDAVIEYNTIYPAQLSLKALSTDKIALTRILCGSKYRFPTR